MAMHAVYRQLDKRAPNAFSLGKDIGMVWRRGAPTEKPTAEYRNKSKYVKTATSSSTNRDKTNVLLTHTHARTYAHTRAHLRTHARAGTHTQTHTHTRTHTLTHIYTNATDLISVIHGSVIAKFYCNNSPHNTQTQSERWKRIDKRKLPPWRAEKSRLGCRRQNRQR